MAKQSCRKCDSNPQPFNAYCSGPILTYFYVNLRLASFKKPVPAVAAIATVLVTGRHTQIMYVLKNLARTALLTTPTYRGGLWLLTLCKRTESLLRPPSIERNVLWDLFSSLELIWMKCRCVSSSVFPSVFEAQLCCFVCHFVTFGFLFSFFTPEMSVTWCQDGATKSPNVKSPNENSRKLLT